MFLDAKVDELPDEGGEEYSRANVSVRSFSKNSVNVISLDFQKHDDR